jgi:hypothetical protein
LATYSKAIGITTSVESVAFTSGVTVFSIEPDPIGKTIIQFQGLVGSGPTSYVIDANLQQKHSADNVWRTIFLIGNNSGSTATPDFLLNFNANAAFTGSNYNESTQPATVSSPGAIILLPNMRISVSLNFSNTNGRFYYNKTVIA